MEHKMQKIKRYLAMAEKEITSLAETQCNDQILLLLAGINILQLKVEEYGETKKHPPLQLYTIFQKTGEISVCMGRWQAHSADEAVSEFLRFNPAYRPCLLWASL